MAAKEKPTKQERLAKKAQEKEYLKEYRWTQAAAAVERDNGCCVFHWFLFGQVVLKQDIHHVFGRGKRAGDWREKYQNLLCTCRECHPQPILSPVPSENMAYIEKVRKAANETPMNMFFNKENYE